YTYLWSNGQTTATATNLAAGQYTVTVRDAAGPCIAVAMVTITQPTLLTTEIVNKTDVLCFGGANGSATVAATGGVTPYTYSWNTLPVQTTATATGLAAGTYAVTVTDANGCVEFKNVVINQPLAALAILNSATVINHPVCFGAANGSVNITVTGGSPPYQYAWSNGSNAANPNGLIAGSYTVIVTDANGCTTIGGPYVLTNPDAVTLTASSVVNTTCNANIGSVILTGNLPGTVVLNGIALPSPASYTGLPAGFYTAFFTANGTGCSATASFNIINTNSTLSGHVSNHTNVSCFGGSNGAVTITPVGGVEPYQFSLNGYPNVASGDFSGLTAGEYNVIITDVNNCSYTVSFDIDEPNLLTLALINKVDVSCFGTASGSIAVLANGGSTPYTFSVVSGPGTPTVSGNIITDMVAGTYSIRVTDSNLCTAKISVTIMQPSAPLDITTVTAQLSHPTCNGANNGSITIYPQGGTLPYSFVWSNGASTPNITDLFSGTYSVTITDAAGCSVTGGPYVLTNPQAVSLSVSNIVNTTCNASVGSALITANVEGIITLNGVSIASPALFTNLPAGYHQATFVSTAGGCSASVGFNIINTDTDLMAMVNIVQPSCDGGDGSATVLVTGGTAPYTFFMNGGVVGNSGVFTNLSEGMYNIQVIDANGCSFNLNFQIIEPTALLAEIIQSISPSCAGSADGKATVNATGGTPPYSYEWNTFPIQTTAAAFGLTAGNYSVQVTDAEGCVTVANVTIVDGLPLSITPIPDLIAACPNTIIPGILLSATPVNSSITYSWTVQGDNIGLSNGTSSGLTPFIPSFATSANAGAATVIVMAQLNTCIAVDTFLITVNANTHVSAGFNMGICVGNTVQLSASASNYTSLNWTTSGTGTFSNPNILNPVYTPSYGDELSSQLLLTLSANGLCGVVSHSIVLTIYKPAFAYAGYDDNICQGESYTITSATAQYFSSLEWTHDGLGVLMNANTLSPTYIPTAGESGIIRLKLKATGVYACGAGYYEDEMILTIYKRVIANAGADIVTPFNTQVTLNGSASNGSGAYAFNWMPSNLLNQSTIEAPTTVALTNNTMFVLKVTDLFTTCQHSDTMMVIISGMNLPPVANPDYDTTKFQTPVVIHILPNDYDPENGALTVTICNNPLNGIVQINSDNTLTYLPYKGFSGDDSLCYRICDQGMPVLCDQTMVYIHVLPEPSVNDLVIFNGVSPNNDGKNDTWYIKGIEDFPDNKVQIFNRWGDEIRSFERYDNTNVFWDATNKDNKLVPDGVYYYILEVQNLKTFTGWIYVKKDN
ncbi:MAG: gliding motility-associated C-terminal domain-containing protein, partial [Bacteroidales bacterium]|nr:gliding motility-associated C-terminal domain-containing protein [Bacteroidales bacterium]